MSSTTPTLRCFPRADRTFQQEVQRLFAECQSATQGDPTPDDLEERLRTRFPSARVRQQDSLATFATDRPIWYVYRREEPELGFSALLPDAPATGETPRDGSPGVPSGPDERADTPGSAPVYSAARVGEMVGLPMSVLVSWDEQEGLVRPARTTGGLPLFSRNDVEELLIAKREFAAGRSSEEVRALLREHRGGKRRRDPSASGSAARRLLVLLAERDPYAAEFTEYFLRTEGYDVEVAYGAAEAEQRASELVPDLAVVELLISGGAGAELCARLKSRPNAVVLAVSSLDFEDAALRAGADAFLSKPFDALQFVSAVKDLMGESALLRPAGRGMVES